MTDSFKEREKAFEAKYHMDQDIQFKVQARRNKLFGLWAAEELGMAGGGAEAYAREVVETNLDEVGDGDIIRKVMADFEEKELEMTPGRLEIKLGRFMEEAKTQVMGEIEAGRQDLSHEP